MSNKRFFTSDTHFDDGRLNLYCRDLYFKTKEEVDDYIISKWNSIVGKNDIIFHLGDAAMTEAGLNKVKQLNGKKILIKGNYDDINQTAKFDISDDLLKEYFDDVFENGLITIGDEKIYLTHEPIHGLSNYFNIVGHIHGAWRVQRNMINVGSDAWFYQPISEELIKSQISGIRNHYGENVFAGELESNLSHKK